MAERYITKIQCQTGETSFSLMVNVVHESPKKHRLLRLPMIAFQNLKLRTY